MLLTTLILNSKTEVLKFSVKNNLSTSVSIFQV